MKKLAFALLIGLLLIGNTTTIIAGELSFVELVEKVELKLNAIEDFSSMASVHLVEGDRINEFSFSIKASKKLMTTRIEMFKPDLFSGQIFLVDQSNQIVKMYIPILNQIAVESLKPGSAGASLDFSDLSSLFNFKGLKGEIIEVIETDLGMQYKVSLAELDFQLGFLDDMMGITGGQLQQYVWLNEEFIPFKIEFYEKGLYIGTFVLDKLEINVELAKEDLVSLPKVPEFSF